MNDSNWKMVALSLIRYLMKRDKCRVHDVVRKAGLTEWNTEIQTAVVTDQRIRRFHQQRVAFVAIPKTVNFQGAEGAEPGIDATIKVLKNSDMGHEEWLRSLGCPDWINQAQWFVRGFYWPYTDSLYFYHGPNGNGLYKGCLPYLQAPGMMKALIGAVGANEHTHIYAGMKLGEPGTIWPYVKHYGHAFYWYDQTTT